MLKRARISALPSRQDRHYARIARQAEHDCRHGGCRALRFAERHRLRRGEYMSIVNQAYTDPNGTARDYTPWECPECGQAYLGADSALACCEPESDDAY